MRIERLLAVVFAAAALAACSTARDVEEQGAAARCTACHGNPPPPFVTGATTHPAATNCTVCHAETVGPDGELIPGGKHMNGTVDRTGHDPYGAAHTTVALADLATCQSCHGDDFDGGGTGVSCNDCHAGVGAGFADWTTNCTFCHGTRTAGASTATALSAPPEGVAGETLETDPHVGAHQAHLAGGSYSAGFTCATCHAVPADLAHLNGAAAVAPAGAGQRQLPASLGSFTAATQSCAVYCHGDGDTLAGANESPAWTETSLACNACHASRPDTGFHTAASGVPNHANTPCNFCHVGYAQDTGVNLDLHVNGARDVAFEAGGAGTGGAIVTLTSGWNCVTCHGANPNFP